MGFKTLETFILTCLIGINYQYSSLQIICLFIVPYCLLLSLKIPGSLLKFYLKLFLFSYWLPLPWLDLALLSFPVRIAPWLEPCSVLMLPLKANPYKKSNRMSSVCLYQKNLANYWTIWFSFTSPNATSPES